MRIAVFYNLDKGGALRVVEEEIKYLKKRHQVRVFKNSLELKGWRPFKDFQNFIILRWDHKKLAEKIDRNKFDVVLVHPDKYTQAPFVLRYVTIPSVYFF